MPTFFLIARKLRASRADPDYFTRGIQILPESSLLFVVTLLKYTYEMTNTFYTTFFPNLMSYPVLLVVLPGQISIFLGLELEQQHRHVRPVPVSKNM
jgi:hypothetical protein